MSRVFAITLCAPLATFALLTLSVALLTLGAPPAQAQAPTLRDLIVDDASSGSESEESDGGERANDAEGAGASDGAEDGSDEGGDETDRSEPIARPVGSTPRSSVRAWLEAVDAGDYAAAARFLDLSRAKGEASELARQLEVVLDKKLWIDPWQLSDEPTGRTDDDLPAGRDRLGTIELDDVEIGILLARAPAAEEPDWRFAAETVAAVPRLYERFGYGPLGTLLPDFFFSFELLDLQLWQWIGLLTLTVVAGVLSWIGASLLAWLVRRLFARRLEQVAEDVVKLVAGPARLAIGVAVFSASKLLLGLAVKVSVVIAAIEDLLFVVAATWAALRLIEVFGREVERRLASRGHGAAATLLPPGRKTLKIVVLLVATLAMLDELGFDVTAVLAGLGVGGIAVALAAQKTVENLFGGATLYADRPVRVGDFCRFGDKIGTVEEIGLRSTRIRTLDRTVVSVPNADFANRQLENFTRRDKIWFHPKIGLRYETTPDQLRYVLVEIRRMLYAHPQVDPDPARIRFVGFGAYSLDLEIFAYVTVTDYGEFLEVAEDLNLRIMDIVERAGTGFAFPSQTTYLEQGEPLDAERQEQVVEQVASWRQQKELYLPRFPEQAITSLRGSIDYPPPGSPDGPSPDSAPEDGSESAPRDGA